MDSFRRRLLTGECLPGAWLNLGSASAAEIAGLAGYPWVLIDREHGEGDERDMSTQVLAADCRGTAPIVRVGHNDPLEIKRCLDYGAAGVMVPMVNTVEEAKAAVSAVRIPPLGHRGVASSARASRFGFGFEDYLAQANDELVTMVQIESALAVENAGAIAAIDGVDVLFVGPTDLSVDLGLQPGTASALLDRAFQHVVAVAKSSGKAAGILARSGDQARGFHSMGFSVLAVTSDRGALARGMRQELASFRASA